MKRAGLTDRKYIEWLTHPFEKWHPSYWIPNLFPIQQAWFINTLAPSHSLKYRVSTDQAQQSRLELSVRLCEDVIHYPPSHTDLDVTTTARAAGQNQPVCCVNAAGIRAWRRRGCQSVISDRVCCPGALSKLTWGEKAHRARQAGSSPRRDQTRLVESVEETNTNVSLRVCPCVEALIDFYLTIDTYTAPRHLPNIPFCNYQEAADNHLNCHFVQILHCKLHCWSQRHGQCKSCWEDVTEKCKHLVL